MHKLQYSKVAKFDASAAVLGAAVGALVVYVGLSGLGSGGAELTDLTVTCVYLVCWVGIGQL